MCSKIEVWQKQTTRHILDISNYESCHKQYYAWDAYTFDMFIKIFVSFDNIMTDADGYDKINIFKYIKRLEKTPHLQIDFEV